MDLQKTALPLSMNIVLATVFGSPGEQPMKHPELLYITLGLLMFLSIMLLYKSMVIALVTRSALLNWGVLP